MFKSMDHQSFFINKIDVLALIWKNRADEEIKMFSVSRKSKQWD
tara:strand:+ start:1446 stop:1577 length:132 start_codon:yes stop_codon:yes gene_type:complete